MRDVVAVLTESTAAAGVVTVYNYDLIPTHNALFFF